MISIYRWRRDIDEWRLFSVATLLFFHNLWTKIQASSSFSVVSGGRLDDIYSFPALWCSPFRLGAADAATLSHPCYSLARLIFSPTSREHVFYENINTRNRSVPFASASDTRVCFFEHGTWITTDITQGDKEIVSKRESWDGVKTTQRILEKWRGRRRQREKRRSQARRKSRRRRSDEMAEL